jgi:uncharacterized coiled-coil DUF342 family protein
MPDEKRKINCLIPTSMYEKIEASEYKNITEAINAALGHLMNDSSDAMKCYIDEIEEYKHSIEGYKQSITVLQVENISLKEEAIHLRVRSEELEKHNSTLKEELSKSGQREEDLKQMHNNYFLQVQTLINQKAIEAPGNKKKWWQFW